MCVMRWFVMRVFPCAVVTWVGDVYVCTDGLCEWGPAPNGLPSTKEDWMVLLEKYQGMSPEDLQRHLATYIKLLCESARPCYALASSTLSHPAPSCYYVCCNFTLCGW